MAHKASEQEISQSVLGFVTEGTYPTSENVISAEFPVSALEKELELISKAREEVEVSSANWEPRAAASAITPANNPRYTYASCQIGGDYCTEPRQ